MEKKVIVIGAGLAGSEAAWQLAKRGVKVDLYEMRPKKMTPAHKTQNFGELVCSNSLRANNVTNAVGLLKEEMRMLDSIIIKCADATQVPAGGALAVDRDKFSEMITETIKNHPNINVIGEELPTIPKGDIPVIVATGPLTSDALSQDIRNYTKQDGLYFYDAAAPIIEKDSIDMDKVYLKSRYDKGEAAYLNCPMTKEEFFNFYNELINAEAAPLKEFEKEIYFEGCMPFEEMAKRGEKTLLFGPMKPVGLEDPKTDKRPYAVVQLRQDNSEGTLYNIVGFQTHLKWGEQKRIINMIPGSENANIVRYGVMHRNTYLNSPQLLEKTYRLKEEKNIYFAGQMTGVEGYVESAASGIVAALNALYNTEDKEIVFPTETMIGAMANYIVGNTSKNFVRRKLMASLLQKTRKISTILQEGRHENVDFEAMAMRLSPILDSVVYILDTEGNILGYDSIIDYSNERMEKIIQDRKVPKAYLDATLKVYATKVNIPFQDPLSIFPEEEQERFETNSYTVILPIRGGGDRLGTLVIGRMDNDFKDEDLVLAEYASTVVGIEILHEKQDKEKNLARDKDMVNMALNSLSFSEKEAIEHIFRELDGTEGLLIASKIADRVGITRSVIVNALRKLESAGIIESKSLGMKGTYIKVLKEYFLELMFSNEF